MNNFFVGRHGESMISTVADLVIPMSLWTYIKYLAMPIQMCINYIPILVETYAYGIPVMSHGYAYGIPMLV